MRHSPFGTSATSVVDGGVPATLPRGADPAPPVSFARLQPAAVTMPNATAANTERCSRVCRVTRLAFDEARSNTNARLCARAFHGAKHGHVALDHACAL